MYMTDKSILRKEYLHIRRTLVSKKEKDKRIFENLISLECVKKADLILAYASSPIEVDTRRFIEYTLKKGKRLALPVCSDISNEMSFYIIKSPDCLVPGKYKGIPEPDKAKCRKAQPGENTVCIVPGLSFDKSGYRLGFGKGYYDRFLSENKVYTVGLCYEECIRENLPFDEHDKTVSVIVTENEIYKPI
ncbi:MAG: 5-formyltetrahydrofolate cyclo-ligase [Acutalibacteraceae bacterium]